MLIGCGLSLLGEDMCVRGLWKNVRAIGYSPVCVERMLKREEERRALGGGECPWGVEYEEMDATSLPYESGSVNAMPDK